MTALAHVDFSALNEIIADLLRIPAESVPAHLRDEMRELLASDHAEVFDVEASGPVITVTPTPRLLALMANLRAIA